MKIALLEDDLTYAETIKEWLLEAGFDVDHFETGLDLMSHFSHTKYDLCIFDWVLPDIDGPEVMASIKFKTSRLPPIIFFTGRSEEEDIIRVIESGADDYIVKPASRALLLARINALLRRSSTKPTPDEVIEFGHLSIDAKRRVVTLDGEEVKLTDKEFILALIFLQNEATLLSRVHLMNVVWGTNAEIETRKVDVHVSHLRTKLKLTPENGWRLTSIYQQGYRLERIS